MLSLKHLKPIAVGSTRLVYPHPTDPDLLVKVMQPDVQRRHRSGSRLRQLRRGRVCKIFLREIREQLILSAHGESPGQFLQLIHGFAETDAGQGMIVEALRGRNGDYAPTLENVASGGAFNDEARAHFQAFSHALLNSRIILTGVHPMNVLYACDEMRGRRFVLIDGFGERAVIPVMGLSRTLNRRNKAHHLDRLAARVERLAAEHVQGVRTDSARQRVRKA